VLFSAIVPPLAFASWHLMEWQALRLKRVNPRALVAITLCLLTSKVCLSRRSAMQHCLMLAGGE
jgi:hypothetical protein